MASLGFEWHQVGEAAMRRLSSLIAVGVVTVACLAATGQQTASAGSSLRVAGLGHPASLTTDGDGITHVDASSLHDAFFLNGWVQARDRLFQMDVNRRAPSGTLAELLGKAALPSDVQARTIGLGRAAERTWAVAPADLKATLEAYADGVNAYTASHP